ncbi:GNAT family N-acetyltransferase [Marinimicrobium sp. ABcell2]|uniref:GNAT family N-acetyltransferase n=1 Tax=Marinimicrobium sp. ABcell2 TaxID=3069751 RepID=UPI0027B542F9|nr:GNAT family N-acetyltransferase [Marinimicrobium sp. ABcell2]MDQ2076299.1 GNAT family N-acetyltransferase [Marinimicrobium sp. ABcell2]
MQIAIEHHRKEQRFSVPTDSEPAVLEYRLLTSTSEPGSVDFTYTYVPAAYRGQGIAEALVRHGLKWAKDEGYEVQASCWYAAKFLR